MKKNMHLADRRHAWKAAFLVVALGMWTAIPYLSNKASAASSVPVLIRIATLTAPGGALNPHGDASFEVEASGDRELEVEIEDVNLAAGSSLDVTIGGSVVGQIVIDVNHKGRLRLDTEAGQTVPDVQEGTIVQVKNGAAVLVSGAFGAPQPLPTPTPTASPSPSPTGSPTGTPTPNPSPSPTVDPNAADLFANLTGSVLNGVVPRGFAEFEVESSHTDLDIRVRQINLPIGTTLDVLVDSTNIGTITLQRGGEGRLRLRSNNGQAVPAVTAGSTISVNNAGAAILAGIFAGNTPGPTPTPTGSPTPAPGRSFEGHLSGNGITPPVTTAGRGEVHLILSADETQATTFGEFEHLSSNETAAMIEVTVGSVTTVIHAFDVLGGHEGHFASVTFAVTPEQVQQLRAGVASATIATVNNPNGEIAGILRQDNNDGDFDGDGNDDLAVFRPSTGVWYYYNGSGVGQTALGTARDTIVAGDFDGDGITDSAVYSPSNLGSTWQIRRSSDGGTSRFRFGSSKDIPLRGDFDGDGRADLAVYSPSTGLWQIQKSDNSGTEYVSWGIPGDKPMPADMDGDGIDDIAVFRPSEGTWYWLRSSDGQVGIAHWGVSTDIPVKADFDGDGKADVAVFRPSNGTWYILRSSDNSLQISTFGVEGDIPTAGDYDNDGKADLAVYRPSQGTWYIFASATNSVRIAQFGLKEDIPVVAR